MSQYDILRKKNAFIDQYRKEPMFEDGLEEFDDAREVAQALLDEYLACERADYIVRRARCAPADDRPGLRRTERGGTPRACARRGRVTKRSAP